jgi:hypothetical protein
MIYIIPSKVNIEKRTIKKFKHFSWFWMDRNVKLVNHTSFNRISNKFLQFPLFSRWLNRGSFYYHTHFFIKKQCVQVWISRNWENIALSLVYRRGWLQDHRKPGWAPVIFFWPDSLYKFFRLSRVPRPSFGLWDNGPKFWNCLTFLISSK